MKRLPSHPGKALEHTGVSAANGWSRKAPGHRRAAAQVPCVGRFYYRCPYYPIAGRPLAILGGHDLHCIFPSRISCPPSEVSPMCHPTAGRCAAQLVLDMTVATIVSPCCCARLGARAALQPSPRCVPAVYGCPERPEVSRAVSATVQVGFMGGGCAMPRHRSCGTGQSILAWGHWPGLEKGDLLAMCGTAGAFASRRATNRMSAGIGPKSPLFLGNRGRRKWADRVCVSDSHNWERQP